MKNDMNNIHPFKSAKADINNPLTEEKRFESINNRKIKHKKIKYNYFISMNKAININLILILIFLFIHIKSQKIQLENNSSYITLVIKGLGNKNIYHARNTFTFCNGFEIPDEVHINGINQSSVNYEYNFNESTNIVKLIWNKKVTSTICLFYLCKDIYEIDFSHFDSSSISGRISGMFNGCKSLISLDFSNFNLTQVTIIDHLFYNCTSLTSVNLSNVDLSKVEAMDHMFYKCINLKTIIFPQSRTPKLQYMGSLFKNCKSLIYIDLSYFITSNVKHMDYVFYNCESLISLNLSNFDTSKTTWIESIFEGCSKLAIETKETPYTYSNAFKNTPENIVICINETNSPKLTGLIKQKNSACYMIDCSDDWQSKQRKIVIEEDRCIDNCNNEINYKYEFNGICQNNCPYRIFIDKKDSTEKCKCENESFYPIENDPLNIGPYINCYKNPNGYYLDKSDLFNWIFIYNIKSKRNRN